MSKELDLTALSIAKGLCQDAFANMVGAQPMRSLEHLRAAIALQELLLAKFAAADDAAEARAVEGWLESLPSRLDALPAVDGAALERGFVAAREAGVQFEGVLTPTEMPHDMREIFEAIIGA